MKMVIFLMTNELFHKLDETIYKNTRDASVCSEKHKKATEHVQRARQILELHYGKWNSALRDILAKEHRLQAATGLQSTSTS